MKKFFSITLCMLIAFSFWGFSSSAEEASPVDIHAKAAVLMDYSSGDILYSYNAEEKLYPASVTKIMSLILFMEAIDSGKASLEDTVTASAEAEKKGGSQIWLEQGETMTFDELLKAVCIASANDACCALGEYIAGSETAFVSLMNEKAKELGMKNTHFDNCTGLDDDTTTHLTTAHDVAIMSRELLKHEIIRNYTTVWMSSLRNGATELVNTNKLIRFYNGATGLKTGTTSKAGKCLSASAERDGIHLIAVVMGSNSSDERFSTAKSLLNYGFANYETTEIKIDESLITDVKIIGGISEIIKPEAEKLPYVTLKKGEKEKIKTEIELATDVEAPVEKGQTLGKISYSLDGKIIKECKLFAGEGVRKMTFTDALVLMLKSLTQ